MKNNVNKNGVRVLKTTKRIAFATLKFLVLLLVRNNLLPFSLASC